MTAAALLAAPLAGCGATDEAEPLTDYRTGGAGVMSVPAMPDSNGGAAGSNGGTTGPGGGATGSGGAGAGSGGATESGGGATGSGGAGAGSGGADVSSGAGSSAGQSDAGTSPGGDGGMGANDGGEPRQTEPGDWGPGDYPPNLQAPEFLEISGVPGQKGYARQYKVHVPPSYRPDVPMPLVFCIHGLGQDALLFCLSGTGMPALSDEKGFILVMPNGYLNSWNGGTCCAAASNEQLDDVALFRALLDEIGTHVNIDRDRVYATGLSNGGFMSYRLACEAADIFAAIAPAAGAIGTNELAVNWDLAVVGSLVGANPTSDFTECTPSRPVPVLDVHGTSDTIVSYALQEPSLAIMAEHNGCSTSTVTASVPASSGDTACVSYEGCAPGIEVTGCTVTGGGHCWFGSPDCGTGAGDLGLIFVGANSDAMVNNDAIWDFFARHPM